MKILFVCQYFYPETFRGNEVAFDWVKRGEDVTVISAIPNYPLGKFFDGYGLFSKRREVVNGVKVIRIPVVPRGKGGAIRLLLNYFSFALLASCYCLYLAYKEKFDIIFVQQLSPVTMALPALVVKRIQKIPLYMWICDLWPESLSSGGGVNNKYILSFFGKIVQTIYSGCTKLLISSRGFTQSILEKGDYSNKITYLPNWAEEVFNNNTPLSTNSNLPQLPEGFLVMFAGNIGEAQDFDNIMNAALLLKNNKNIKFVIVGDGRKKEWTESFVKDNQLEETVFLMGRFPIETMPSFFEKADIMLISLKNEVIFNLTAPSKLQPYMASGKPVIAMLNGEGASVIRDANCGLIANAGDFEDLANKIEQMSNFSDAELQTLGDNGQKYCNEYFDKDKSLQHLYDLMKKGVQQ